MKKKQKKRHKPRRLRRQAEETPQNTGAIPAYISDPSLSIDRVSRILLHDLRGRNAAEAVVVYEAGLARIDSELVQMLQSSDSRLARRAARIAVRMHRAYLLACGVRDEIRPKAGRAKRSMGP